MNVWIRKTKRKSNCFYCEREIETGSYQVICTYFMKVHGGKTWTKRMIFHTVPNCWLERAVREIESRPKVENRGRKQQISDPMKEARNKVLRRRASVVQRIGREMSERVRPVKLIHLAELLEGMKEEMQVLGGVPENWN